MCKPARRGLLDTEWASHCGFYSTGLVPRRVFHCQGTHARGADACQRQWLSYRRRERAGAKCRSKTAFAPVLTMTRGERWRKPVVMAASIVWRTVPRRLDQYQISARHFADAELGRLTIVWVGSTKASLTAAQTTELRLPLRKSIPQ